MESCKEVAERVLESKAHGKSADAECRDEWCDLDAEIGEDDKACDDEDDYGNHLVDEFGDVGVFLANLEPSVDEGCSYSDDNQRGDDGKEYEECARYEWFVHIQLADLFEREVYADDDDECVEGMFESIEQARIEVVVIACEHFPKVGEDEYVQEFSKNDEEYE